MMTSHQAILYDMYQSGPIVFGHRGASAYAPMNTIPAFELAASMGAQAIELDVWLSKDDELVIIHDATVDHTTNGTGYVWDKTLAELKSLRASHKFTNEYPQAQIPTLDEVFEAVGQKLIVNVEIKFDPGMRSGVEAAVAACIYQHGMERRTLISSFHPQVLYNFRQVAPDIPIAFLHEPSTDAEAWPMVEALGLRFEVLHPHHSQIDEAYMDFARTNDLLVNTWTVNDPDRAMELMMLGVNGLCSDVPDVMLALLGY